MIFIRIGLEPIKASTSRTGSLKKFTFSANPNHKIDSQTLLMSGSSREGSGRSTLSASVVNITTDTVRFSQLCLALRRPKPGAGHGSAGGGCFCRAKEISQTLRKFFANRYAGHSNYALGAPCRGSRGGSVIA